MSDTISKEFSKKFRLVYSVVFANRRDLMETVSGINRTTITNYTKGEARPTVQNLKHLFDLGVNTNWLLDETNTCLDDMFRTDTKGNELKKRVYSSLEDLTNIS